MSSRRKDGPARIGPLLPARTRRWAYGVAAAAAPLAVIYGYVTDQQAVLWLNLAGSILFTMAVGNTPARNDDEGQDT